MMFQKTFGKLREFRRSDQCLTKFMEHFGINILPSKRCTASEMNDKHQKLRQLFFEILDIIIINQI